MGVTAESRGSEQSKKAEECNRSTRAEGGARLARPPRLGGLTRPPRLRGLTRGGGRALWRCRNGELGLDRDARRGCSRGPRGSLLIPTLRHIHDLGIRTNLRLRRGCTRRQDPWPIQRRQPCSKAQHGGFWLRIVSRRPGIGDAPAADFQPRSRSGMPGPQSRSHLHVSLRYQASAYHASAERQAKCQRHNGGLHNLGASHIC
eukprot:356635-Chlamydomonas_euryale.AAC.1